MHRPQRDKDFPIFSSSGSAIKKKTVQQAATCVPIEAKQGDANTWELTLTDQATMEQILAEIKFVASRAKDMEESVGALLDIIDGALSKIKVSVTSVESSLSAQSNQVTDLEKCMDEFEEMVSATEDSHGAHSACIAAMEKQ